MKRTTRRELVVAAGATALTASVPPAWGRLTSKRAGVTAGAFYDGVASGEPGPDAVTLWTRMRTERPRAGARLLVAEDKNMRRVVAETVVPTGPGVNWTLKARVGGLEPHTDYYYQWFSSNTESPVGHTRTRPGRRETTSLRIGFSSCQHYNFGYFSPHTHAAKEDLDLYLFLGDYIYEKGDIPPGAVRIDRNDGVDLATYREKYRVYRRDTGLRELHRQHPMLHIWDDHEVANNYSQNIPYATPQQRVAAYRAAFEWLPRMVYPTDRFRLYKRIPYGALADVFLLDTRQYRTGDNDGQPRHIIPESQLQWLIKGLTESKALWKIVANQVVMAQDPYGTGGSQDQWDGYPDDRARLLGAIEAAGVRNVAILTGDAHVFLCSLIGTDPAALVSDPNRMPAAVEYVGGSVTSPGFNRPEAEARVTAPWIQQYNGAAHGYALLTLDENNLVVEYRRSDLNAEDGATQAFERFTQPRDTNRVVRETLAIKRN
jgi:phosphodiesterase/alkaline phosphatase D-like protein